MHIKNHLTRLVILLLVGIVLHSCSQSTQPMKESVTTELRAPAYPLVTIDPYTSAWSMADNLYDDAVRHRTDIPFPRKRRHSVKNNCPDGQRRSLGREIFTESSG